MTNQEYIVFFKEELEHNKSLTDQQKEAYEAAVKALNDPNIDYCQLAQIIIQLLTLLGPYIHFTHT